MSRIASPILIAFLAIASIARAGDSAYDVIERAYAPYMTPNDPLAFPMKVKSLAADPYKFWRGSKDLFFGWCKTNATDWFADRNSFLPNHGDLHLGNIGTYASDGGWNKLAFGMVDFDDSAVLPFEIELLQGLITLHLIARQNSLALDDVASTQLAQVLFDSYRVAANSQRNATRLLLDNSDPTVTRMFEAARGTPYQAELDAYTSDGKFKPVVTNEAGKVKEMLRPAMDLADRIAAGLAQSLANEPDAQKLFRCRDAESIRPSIKDIVQRTRLGSSGSQGLKKYLVLLDRPIAGIEHDVIIYLKQEIPSAAERSGAVPASAISPGQRVKQHMDRLNSPLPYLNSWCDVGAEAYWVGLKEPWSQELSPDEVKTADELLHMARIWGTVAGATHREDGRFELILPRLKPALLAQIRERAAAFVKRLDEDFTAFRADPRVASHLLAVEAAIHAPLATLGGR